MSRSLLTLRSMRSRVIPAALLLAIAIPQQVALSSVGPATAAVVVNLNGRKLADATRQTGSGGEEVLVSIADIMRAVDGAAPSTSRLRVTGRTLLAAAVGNCDRCTVRVVRPVVMSSDVRVVDGVPLFPLDDLVKAFEGRLEVNAERTVYGIFAGKCTWCILEPQ